MNYHHESMKAATNRFAWIDNTTFKMVSSDGIERIIDITNNFKEVEFNVIQMYDKEKCDEKHIILDYPSPKPQDTL